MREQLGVPPARPLDVVDKTYVDNNKTSWINVLNHGADPTGKADSTAAFKDAVAALPATGGWVYAPSGSYLISSTIALTEFQCVRGDGKSVTTLNYTGTGACISATNTAAVPSGLPTPCGFMGFTIDGTGAGTGAVGLQLGNLFDSFGTEVIIQNFTTAGAIGLYFKNYGTLPVTNRLKFREMTFHNNTSAVTFDASNVNQIAQFAYSDFQFFIVGSGLNQSGVTLQNSANIYSSVLHLQGSFVGDSTASTGWVIGIDPESTSTYQCGVSYCNVYASFESDNASGVGASGSYTGPTTIKMGTKNNNVFTMYGALYFDVGSFQPAVIPLGNFLTVSGPIVEPMLASSSIGDCMSFIGGVQRNVLTYTSADISAKSSALSLQMTSEILELFLPSGETTISGFAGEPYVTSRSMEILLRQPSSGAPATVTWPSNIKFTGTNTLSEESGAVDKLSLVYYPEDQVWYGDLHTGYSTTPTGQVTVDMLDTTGTASASTFLSGSGAWAVPPSVSYSAGTGLELTGTTFSTSNVPVADIVGLSNSATTVASTTPAADEIAEWDADVNLSANNFLAAMTSTATAAGTTTLTITSAAIQVFTGTKTQTVTLPTTSVPAGGQYRIINTSTGAVSVESSAADAVLTVAAGTEAIFIALVATPTTAANWTFVYEGVGVASGKVAAISNSLTLAGTDGTTMTFPSTSDTVATLAATQTLTNKTMSGASNTFSTIPLGSLDTTGTASSSTYLSGAATWTSPPGVAPEVANATGVLPGANGGTGIANTFSGNLMSGIALNLDPAYSGLCMLPTMFNDIAYNDARGGSITTTLNGAAVTMVTPEAMFAPDSTFGYLNTTTMAATDTLVITVNCCVQFAWNMFIGIMQDAGFRCSSVKIEYYQAGTVNAWATLFNQTGLTDGLVFASTPSFGGTSHVTQLRYTLTNTANGYGPRIVNLFALAFNSPLLAGSFMPYGGGTMYGPINMNGNAITGLPAASVPVSTLDTTGAASGTTFLDGAGAWSAPVTAGTGISVSATNVVAALPTSYSTTVGDGTHTTLTVTHNLGTQNVIVEVMNATTFEIVNCDKVATTANEVTLTFATAPSTGQYAVTVAGGFSSVGVAAGSITSTQLASGAVGIANISATGTAGATTFLRGDGSWAVPSLASSSVTMADLDTTGTASNSTWLSGAGAWRVMPYDLSIVAFGASTMRSVGTGDFPFGVLINRAVLLTSVTYRCSTADASGSSSFELLANGSAIAGTSLSVTSGSQTGTGNVVTGSWGITAGTVLTVSCSATGNTPGYGLIADITGTVV